MIARKLRRGGRMGVGAAIALTLSLVQPGVPVGAAPTVTATDHDINWGAAEKHFTQNKQAESPMATNPTNALNSITGAIDFIREPDCSTDSTGGSLCLPGQTINTIGAYTTKDGGTTWTKQILDFSSIGKLANADPGVAFGPKPDDQGEFSYENGARAYFSAMAFPLGNVGIFSEPVVVVTTSDDGGVTWTNPRIATGEANPKAKFNDKPGIWADNNPASPYFGNVYLVWALVQGVDSSGSTFLCSTCPFSIQFARSKNGGRTWSEPKQLSPKTNTLTGGYPELPNLRTDPQGRVIVAWENHIGATRLPSQMVSRVSVNGGESFDEAVVIGPVHDMNPLPGTLFPNFNDLGLDVDQSTGTIYATWANYSSVSTSAGHARVVVMKSQNHGESWTSAGTIDVPGRSAFHPSIAVGRKGAAPPRGERPGRVLVGFTALTDVPNTTPPVTGAVNYLPYLVASDDGGASWSLPEVPRGALPSDPAASGGFLNDLGSEFVGDYSSASAAPDGKTFYFSYTSAQKGTGCAAVDAYRIGVGPNPNVYTSCAPTFGNVNIHVAVVASR